MNNNLKQLIELQKIDSRLLSIEESKGDLPSTVKKLTEELDNTKKEEQLGESKIKEIFSEIKKETANIEDSSVKLSKLKDQLYLVKSNKEYDALSFEIDHLKELIKTSEDRAIELEEHKENIENNNKNYAVDINDVEKTLDEKNTELSIAISNTEKEESELNKSRLKVVDTIDTRFLSSYNRLREARGGMGIVNICSNACGACYTQLPKQTIIEVKGNSSIIPCPNCSTYMFFEE